MKWWELTKPRLVLALLIAAVTSRRGSTTEATGLRRTLYL